MKNYFPTNIIQSILHINITNKKIEQEHLIMI